MVFSIPYILFFSILSRGNKCQGAENDYNSWSALGKPLGI